MAREGRTVTQAVDDTLDAAGFVDDEVFVSDDDAAAPESEDPVAEPDEEEPVELEPDEELAGDELDPEDRESVR